MCTVLAFDAQKITISPFIKNGFTNAIRCHFIFIIFIHSVNIGR
ncbi:hypothetical protein IFVP408_C1100002 [Vibrio parahaemolyticus]